MGKKMFFASFAAIFSLLLVVQGYFALHEDAVKELRADRIGASFVDLAGQVAEAGNEIAGMSVYLTMETEGNGSSEGQLFINGACAGDFRRGILTLRVKEGDELALKNAEGEKVFISDYPENLDETFLSREIIGEKTMVQWGKIVFK
ncbi:MAG: hypothetical protein ACI3W6_04595 [Clostridia bacterium]